MKTALFSFKKDSDGRVRMAHVFFGETKAAAETELRQHAEICPKFGPAWRANQTIEFARDLYDELPPADGDELEEWLENWFAGEEAEDEPIDIEE